MSDLSVSTAVRDILLPITRPDGSNLIRQTTLAAATVAGSGTISLTNAAGFAQEGIVFFADTLGEEPLVPSSIAANTITVDSADLGYTAPRFVHASGTSVYTNLFAYVPWDIAPLLDAGDPAIFVTVLREHTSRFAMQATQGVYMLHLQYHRLLMRPGGPTLPTNVWAYRQETTARADLSLIRETLLGNQELITANAPAQAVQFASPGSTTDLMQTDWGKTQVDEDTWHFVATLDITITGVGEQH
jgi:hypothetical protein